MTEILQFIKRHYIHIPQLVENVSDYIPLFATVCKKQREEEKRKKILC